jgi:hypothetical protein
LRDREDVVKMRGTAVEGVATPAAG